MCPEIPGLTQTPRSGWEETHGGGAASPRACWSGGLLVQAPELRAWPWERIPSLLHASCCPHPTPPCGGIPRGVGTAHSSSPGRGAHARCVLEASEGVSSASASRPRVHTCSSAGPSHGQPHSAQQTPEVARDSRNPWKESSPPPTPPQGPCQRLRRPCQPTRRERERAQERVMAERRAGKPLSQEDKRRAVCYTRSILNRAAPTTLP